jgi:hypothetical protein
VYVRTAQYYSARRINSVLKIFGQMLLHATSTAIYRAEGNWSSNSIITDPDSVIVSLDDASSGVLYSALLGQFLLPDGRKAVLLQNQDDQHELWASVEFRDLRSMVEVDGSSGEEGPLYDESPAYQGLQLRLEAGAARLFICGNTTLRLGA